MKPGGKRLVLGVSGSIAAYKAADLASQLTKRGHDVTCVLTRSARALVTPATFHPLTGNPVHVDLFAAEGEGQGAGYRVEHVGLADHADLLVIAPATANVIGKVANGIADDFLTTLILAYAGPVLVCPAMNDRMYAHPAFRRNLATLAGFPGYEVMEPEAGDLACGREGTGRLADVARIVARIDSILLRRPSA